MRIRPIAFCLGVSVMPGFAITAQAGTTQAGYDVSVLQNVGWAPAPLTSTSPVASTRSEKPPDTVPLPPATTQ
jgi:hypothetical protein